MESIAKSGALGLSQAIDDITIPWSALTRPVILRAGVHRRHVRAACVPIVFVPGIMGSRLISAESSKVVWDPDELPTFLSNHAFARRQATRPALFELESLPAHSMLRVAGDFSPEARLNGFEQLVQLFYAPFAEHMREHLRHKPPLLKLCFDTPLFAAAYNWVGSPLAAALEVAHRLRSIVNFVHAQRQDCPGVVLVTHSLGGLIARAAAKLFALDISILGMVHVGQPTLGAPAAYARMKVGNPPEDESWRAFLQAGVLGRTGREVTALMGRMSGALCLLPQPQPGGAWLNLDRRLRPSLLSGVDVNRQIFREEILPWGLADPALLCLGSQSAEKGFAAFTAALDAAQVFHDKLGLWLHPNTCHVVGTGVPTVESVGFRVESPGDPMEMLPEKATRDLRGWRRHYECGGFWAEWSDSQASGVGPWRVDMHQLRGDGDGTVPIASALGACHSAAREQRITKVAGARHDAMMCNPEVNKAIFEHLLALLRLHFFEA